MSQNRKKMLRFEEAFQRIGEIVEILEKGESTLDESMALFEEGTELTEFCMKKLEQAELRLQKLTKNQDGSLRLDEADE